MTLGNRLLPYKLQGAAVALHPPVILTFPVITGAPSSLEADESHEHSANGDTIPYQPSLFTDDSIFILENYFCSLNM